MFLGGGTIQTIYSWHCIMQASVNWISFVLMQIIPQNDLCYGINFAKMANGVKLSCSLNRDSTVILKLKQRKRFNPRKL